MRDAQAMIPLLETVQRTLAVDIAYTISRMQVLERIPGNPLRVGYRWIDENAVALMAYLPSFARVVGLRAGQEQHIAPLVAWYREHGIEPTFEMVPGHYDPSLGGELARLGFFQDGFHSSLIGEPHLIGPPQGDIEIERVNTPDLMESYLDAYVAGWGIPEKDRTQFKVNVRPWLGQPGWSLYLARLDGRPAAAATLYLKDRAGYLADATTDPPFRCRGLQSALLRRRISDAAAAGADLVFSGATPFSTSQRNMERVGLHLQFTRSLWRPS